MTIIPQKNKYFYVWQKKRFAKPMYFGQSVFGFSDFGDKSLAVKFVEYGREVYGHSHYAHIAFLSGIYQVRTRYGHRTQTRMRYYQAANPQHANQQIWRAVFADAVVAWQALTSAEKKVYNIKSYGSHKSGYNVFLGEYLKAH